MLSIIFTSQRSTTHRYLLTPRNMKRFHQWIILVRRLLHVYSHFMISLIALTKYVQVVTNFDHDHYLSQTMPKASNCYTIMGSNAHARTVNSQVITLYSSPGCCYFSQSTTHKSKMDAKWVRTLLTVSSMDTLKMFMFVCFSQVVFHTSVIHSGTLTQVSRTQICDGFNQTNNTIYN